MKYQIGVIGSSEEKEEGLQRAKKVGKEIARTGNVIITGGCTGLPYQAIKGAKEENGRTVGVSPAQNKKEHSEDYRYPVENHDAMIYTGFGYKGRNVILVRSCDGLIAVSGRMGTLNEMTIAYGERKPLGLLKGSSGAADEFEKLSEKFGRPGRTVVSSRKPDELVQRLLKKIGEK